MRERERPGAPQGAATPEVTLPDAVSLQRARLAALEERLAPRRKAEAAELEALAREQEDARRRTGQAHQSIAQARVNLVALEQRRKTLEQGLSRAQRSWLRLGEPVLGALLLFFSLTVIGLALNHHLRVAGFEVVGFFLGLAIAQWRRGAQR